MAFNWLLCALHQQVCTVITPCADPAVLVCPNAGDGTGLPLGINASGPGIALLIVFFVIWALFYNSQKDLDKGVDSDDSGLSL
jgi:hypothetical protein